MCGIAGWFSPRPLAPEHGHRLRDMIGRLAHRGPDDNGLLLVGNAALGHTRLAIIDLAGGVQPMSSEDGETHIVFNGEIYNFLSLRNELMRDGVQFRTNSDTEVVLKLFENRGWESFSRLRGMYALAIWHNRSKTAWLARDPSGIKPLFIKHEPNGQLTFASEAKAILASQTDSVALDENALHLLLNFRYLPGNRSLFRDITQLNPGEVIAWRPDGTVRQYAISPPPAAEQDLNVLDVLVDSVNVHLTSDVEVGAYLSGGIDSASVVALLKSSGKKNVRTFTLEVGDDPREAHNAARTAALLGVPNVAESPLMDVRDALPRMIWHLELPKINGLQVYQLARLAARHVKVALSGLGADELFLGYNAHRILGVADKVHRFAPRFVTQVLGNSATALIRGSGSLWSEAERSAQMLGSLGSWHRVYGLLRNVWDTPALRRLIYGPRMLDAKLENAFTVLGDLWPDDPDPVMAMAKFEWKQKMVNDLLWQEDRLSMAEGLEVRVPFVDVILRQRMEKIPRSVLMPHGHPKGYLRNLLQPVLPSEILNRPKSGFQVDAPSFFDRYLAPLADDMLSESSIRNAGLFNPEFVKTVRKYPVNARYRWHFFMLYLMLGTHLWLEAFEKHRWPPR